MKPRFTHADLKAAVAAALAKYERLAADGGFDAETVRVLAMDAAWGAVLDIAPLPPKRAQTWTTCSKGHETHHDIGACPERCARCGAAMRRVPA